jgi:hypothetical protein
MTARRLGAIVTLATLVLLPACQRSEGVAGAKSLFGASDTLNQSADSLEALTYAGTDPRGIPHYTTRQFSPDEADILRRAYGIEDPHRLYVSDSTEDGILKYDTQLKRCATCYVNSYRVGFVSVRRPGESWEEAERRVRSTPARAFVGGDVPGSTSTADLDPDARPLFDRMLADARAAGFRLRVSATYRSPLREAFLMAQGRGRTHTLTSAHSYGLAADVVVDDGQLGRAATRRDWIGFRRWVNSYRTPDGERFHLLGKVDSTWDWPPVEWPTEHVGFRTIDAAIARGRACLAPRPTVSCNFAPNLPARLGHALVS